MSCLERDRLTQQLIEAVKSYSDAVNVEQAREDCNAALMTLLVHEHEHGCACVKPGIGIGREHLAVR